jgi:hypothetical protein
MTCGCLNHGVYTWEMPCPLWKEKIDDVVANWHEGEDVKQFGKHLTLPEYVYEILGVREEIFEKWVVDPDIPSGF